MYYEQYFRDVFHQKNKSYQFKLILYCYRYV